MGTEIQKWSDGFMFTAEESKAEDGPRAYLLGAPVDPLGQIAACCKMYKGEVVRDLADVTDEERREYLEQIQKTVLTMPLEAVSLHFMVEGVTRSLTHQMVRQRTAAFAQESMRFAVKEDAATAVQRPPSLDDTLSWDELVKVDLARREAMGFVNKDDEQWRKDHATGLRDETLRRGGPQAQRILWDDEIDRNAETYLQLVNTGMPAEDARGITVHNITTRLNYITNLRSWYDTMSKRIGDQAQFEWRRVIMHMILAMRQFGERTNYETWVFGDNEIHPDDVVVDQKIDEDGHVWFRMRRSSYWQYEALGNELKPIEFKLGGPAFDANFDRPSRIGERVRAFAAKGVPSSRWLEGAPEHNIPAIHPDEWLLDPNSARLAPNEEFDIFGQRVAKGMAWHWMEHEGRGILFIDTPDGRQYAGTRTGPSYNPDDAFAADA